MTAIPIETLRHRVTQVLLCCGVTQLHAAPTAAGVERVMLPGEREWDNYRRALTCGIDLPPDVREKLQQAAALTGVLLNEH